jgi:hypothetical protein
MKQIVCPMCKSERVYHYTDVYVVRTPIMRDDGKIELHEFETEEFQEFFKCRECGLMPWKKELLASAIDVSD